MRASCLAQSSMLPILVCLCVACQFTESSRRSETEPVQASRVTAVHVRGKNYLLSLTSERIQATPRWTLRDGSNPSILPGKAVSLARRKLSSIFADANSWSVGLVALKPASELFRAMDAFQDRWYYEVTFRPPEPDPSSGLAQSYIVYVLADGDVVAPQDSGIDDIEPVAAPNAGPAGGAGNLGVTVDRPR